jgi:hypothetical protein
MPRQHSQYGNESREYPQRSQGMDEPGRSQHYSNSNTPLEWDDRQYGRDFNDDPNDGGRGTYSGDSRGNRVQGGNQGWYGGQGETYRSRESMRRGASYSAPNSNIDSQQKYGGSDTDYGSDSSRNESRRSSSQRYGGTDFGREYYGSDYGRGYYERASSNYEDDSPWTRGNEGVANRWNGTPWNGNPGTGEWRSTEDNAGLEGQAYARSAGRAYDSAYGSSRNRQGNDFDTQQGGRYQSQGERSFRGRGPKGYERSDERTKEMVCEMLTDAPHIDASNITVEVKNKEVTLTGSVKDRRAKYAVEELIEQRTGVNEIHNLLRVETGSIQNYSAQGQSAGSSASTQSGSRQGASTSARDQTSGRDQDGSSSGSAMSSSSTTNKGGNEKSSRPS